MKKIFFTLLTLIFALATNGQTSDPTSLLIFRMDQEVIENSIFTELQGNDIGYPTSTGLFEKDDTIKYQSGQVFRICEVRHNELNGQYKIFYPSGKIYITCIYQENVQTDSTLIFNPQGQLESIIRFFSATHEEQLYYDKERKVKCVEHIEIISTDKVTFNSGFVYTNQKKINKN